MSTRIKILVLISIFMCVRSNAQDINLFQEINNNLITSFESNSQWYLNDRKFGSFEEEEHLRTTKFLRLDYSIDDKLKAGLQLESYTPENLLNNSKLYDKDIGIGTYYLRYTHKKTDITLGYFYEQFGSGLILRSWEDRFLGVNTALRGARIKYILSKDISVKLLFGQQRKGFRISEGKIFGFDTEIELSNFLLKSRSNSSLIAGLSYVGNKDNYNSSNPNAIEIPEIVDAFSFRLDYSNNNFYSNAEYVKKSGDLRSNAASPANGTTFSEEKLFDGSALSFTAGYTKKGFGLSYNFRRLENMRWFSEREYGNLATNPTNQLSINYLPALNKQHDYTLANIYLYQSQPGLIIDYIENPLIRAGEIGQFIDLFYNFKKNSLIGGKYGTKLNINMSYWANLNTKKNDPNGIEYFAGDDLTYESDFLNFENKLFTDLNVEIRKKWNKKLSSIFTYIDLFYDKSFLDSKYNGSKVRAWIGVAESTYKFNKGKSLRLELQHLSTNDDARNWMGGTAEFFFNSKFGIYINDSYNYEESNIDQDTKIHFFNIGASYAKNASRIALNYGRQRGGLICVGGVCRPVSPNTGLTLNITTSF